MIHGVQLYIRYSLIFISSPQHSTVTVVILYILLLSTSSCSLKRKFI